MGMGVSGGRRGRRRQPMADINVTPMVDVMLVLLIIFMVAAPLLVTGVAVDLPKTAAKALPSDNEPISVTIDRRGERSIGGDAMNAATFAVRLAALQTALAHVIAAHRPARAAAEEVFVNKNPQSTLKLAQARGAVLATCGAAGVQVAELAARAVKKAVVGTGAADKVQVQAMLKVLLPGVAIAGADAADALAVAIAAAHLGQRS